MSIDEIYLKIASDISNEIKTQWCVASVTCELEEDAAEFDCVYIDDLDSAVEHDFDVSYETYKAFKKLHEITTEGGEQKWSRAKFTLYPAGEFIIDFE
tara:strand:- start:211 stop:504 length:294 start_codon:yes stop_codon:yes gene_type:complete